MAVGNRGESLAATHLKRSGWRIVGRNVSLGFGEIDVVAEARAGTIAVVEVKTVTRTVGAAVDASWTPERQVDRAKREQLRKLAAALCAAKRWERSRVRFDVIAVELLDDGTHELRHHAGAFGWREHGR